MNRNVNMVVPSENTVREACQRFEDENRVVEDALKQLFSQYPSNNDESQILLKVVTLNRLYGTQIFAVHDMARHIYSLGPEIDAGLASGAPGIVDKVAKVLIASTGKERMNYSFATKYCSWHNSSSYPLWDSRVCSYLAALKNPLFSKPDRWTRYSEFVAMMCSFREHYHLDLFGFKDLDKFLWLHGGEPDKPSDIDPAISAH